MLTISFLCFNFSFVPITITIVMYKEARLNRVQVKKVTKMLHPKEHKKSRHNQGDSEKM